MPGPEGLAIEVGTEAGGFRIKSPLPAELCIEAWGYWTPELANAFAKHAPAAARKFSALKVFLLEAANLKPQGTEGQESLRELFRVLATFPFSNGSIQASNALTRMQLTRLLRECGLDGRIGFVDSST